MADTSRPSEDVVKQADVVASSTLGPVKTPLYQAIHAARYQRQALIARIESRAGRRLICYISGKEASILRDDTVGFVDLLHNIHGPTAIDLMLHTGGGDIDAAEKLINLVLAKAGGQELRAIVPDFAKSAGTLMVLGADKVVMSDMSELGPIDPQVVLTDSNGNRLPHSVQGYLDAFEHFSTILRKTPADVPALTMLQKLDPATIKLFETVKDRARRFAEQQLKRGMFRTTGGNCTETAAQLIDTKRWQSHGQMISWEAAVGIGLNIEHLASDSEEWQDYWQLYCLQHLSISDRQKLFESDYVSLTMNE